MVKRGSLSSAGFETNKQNVFLGWDRAQFFFLFRWKEELRSLQAKRQKGRPHLVYLFRSLPETCDPGDHLASPCPSHPFAKMGAKPRMAVVGVSSSDLMSLLGAG